MTIGHDELNELVMANDRDELKVWCMPGWDKNS